jgi:rifampicin phosphotransferase
MSETLARPAGRLVTPLSALGRDDLRIAGGKGANLGELIRGGFPVPDGFVVGTEAYATVVESAGLARVIADGLAADGGDAAIRAAFAGVSVPDALAAAIVDAYRDLGGGPVAVRSSATAEDLPGAAFAGQQDTYLNVVGEQALLDAVRGCWGSLWTDRAIAYRRRQEIGSGEVRMAVVVQRMVDAEFAGVMFTANPVTGERSQVVVDASSGLGEAVVSGLVTPDHYVVDGRGAVIARAVGRREVVIRSADGGGVTRSADRDVTTMPDTVLAELAALGRAVAGHFGRPQDVEWAHAKGRVWLVQARPMTALPPPPIRLNRLQRAIGLQLMDYVSVRPYPLDMSAWILPGIGRMVQRMLGEIAGLRIDFTEMLPEQDGVVERFVPPVPRPTPAVLAAPIRVARRVRRYDPATWTDDPRYAWFQQRVRELDELDPTGSSWPELARLARRALAAMDLVTDLRVDYLPGVGVALLRLRIVLALLGLRGLTGLLATGARTRTEDANRALEDLAAAVRADPALRAAVEELDAAALAVRIEDDAPYAAFRGQLRRFLAEYGHRETVSPLLMSAPTWGEAPATVLDLVAVLVEERLRPARSDRIREAERRLLDHRLVRPAPVRRRVSRLLEAARTGVALREDTHFDATRVLPALRRTLLEAGRRLVAAGILREPEDVYHLRLEELESMAEPDRLPVEEANSLRRVVGQRAARRAELAGVPMISPAALRPPSGTDADALVSGVGASAGRVTGPVRVIRGPAEFGTMRSGDVLVCPYTNPAWTPLFQRAAAVVVDSGGLGSHAAIVAREYGIPAVMGTGTGTSVLVDGQRVTVDGDTGRVTAVGQ